MLSSLKSDLLKDLKKKFNFEMNFKKKTVAKMNRIEERN